VGRATFDDGSFVLAWMQTPVGPGETWLAQSRSFAETGEALTGPTVLPTSNGQPAVSERVNLAVTGEGLVAAWGSGDGVSVAQLDRLGRPVQAARIVVSGSQTALALASPSKQSAILAWAAPLTKDDEELRVQSIGADGALVGRPAVLVHTGSFLTNLTLVVTPVGAMAIYYARQDRTAASYRTFALPLRCAN
jgi:hypothetical protein